MKTKPKRRAPEQAPATPEVQQGRDRGIGKEDRLEQVVRQHPQRDEPRVDSVEPLERRGS